MAPSRTTTSLTDYIEDFEFVSSQPSKSSQSRPSSSDVIVSSCCVASSTAYNALYIFITMLLLLIFAWLCWICYARHFVKREAKLKIEKRRKKILAMAEKNRPDLARGGWIC
ncbi:unnamed protein product [Bursaphelenchus okinawaensis]|uniref:Uncharacterized protein n=1 Tax=Bursaphelenchus okinawaensis TaxID=465554 RepID=A0A811K2I4_9BILA|nr:unnamed protein product [Bursaphelenchus okinawaensis]CAG9090289.1 unnamed protein product [Bursaphelenchus okinawaensis]